MTSALLIIMQLVECSNCNGIKKNIKVIFEVKFEKGIAEKFLFELPHMLITWYCVVQSHNNIRVDHLEVVMSQQEKR